MSGKLFKGLREAKKYQEKKKKERGWDYKIYNWKRGKTYKYFVGTYTDWLDR
jgi:hypothetical protein